MPAALILALSFLLLGGCAGPAPRWDSGFPIGLYNVPSHDHFGLIAETGFDTVQTYSHDPAALKRMAMAAREHGLRLLAHPHELLKSSAAATRDWPVLAWYLADEPHVNDKPPSWVEAFSREVSSWDPNRRQAFVLGSGWPMIGYGHLADAVMIDWYPVPHLPLDSVAEQIDIAAPHIPKGKPLWFVVQAFDWRDYPQRNPDKPRIGRFPTPGEIRFMSYISLVHGARGLFYFCFERPDGRLRSESPGHWKILANMVKEVSSLKPWLLADSKRRRFPKRLGRLEGRVWDNEAGSLLILINRDGSETATVPLKRLRGWEPFFPSKQSIPSVLAPREVLLLKRPK